MHFSKLFPKFSLNMFISNEKKYKNACFNKASATFIGRRNKSCVHAIFIYTATNRKNLDL